MSWITLEGVFDDGPADLTRPTYPGFDLWVINLTKEQVRQAVTLWIAQAGVRASKDRVVLTRENIDDLAYEYWRAHLSTMPGPQMVAPHMRHPGSARRVTHDFVSVVRQMVGSHVYKLKMSDFAPLRPGEAWRWNRTELVWESRISSTVDMPVMSRTKIASVLFEPPAITAPQSLEEAWLLDLEDGPVAGVDLNAALNAAFANDVMYDIHFDINPLHL